MNTTNILNWQHGRNLVARCSDYNCAHTNTKSPDAFCDDYADDAI